jgi:cell wall-associated NlpC family hydrolase
MIHPYELIGLPYRLGATPEKHEAADCLSLAKAVLAFQGVETPEPTRDWYRRIKRGDTSIFKEELERWGQKVEEPRIPTVALCHGPLGLGMASFFEDGWIHFSGSEAIWSPIGALQVVGLYSSRMK